MKSAAIPSQGLNPMSAARRFVAFKIYRRLNYIQSSQADKISEMHEKLTNSVKNGENYFFFVSLHKQCNHGRQFNRIEYTVEIECTRGILE
jgi:hypothetical protein